MGFTQRASIIAALHMSVGVLPDLVEALLGACSTSCKGVLRIDIERGHSGGVSTELARCLR